MRIYRNNATLRMKVKLTHPKPSYHVGRSNPAVGSRYECVGEIQNISNDSGTHPFNVRWQTGHTNNYAEGELSAAKLAAGTYRDIWREL